jgi:carbamoyltransferase
MASYVLGISAFYHDAAAALLRDGEVVAAAQEERFSRVKHDKAFPAQAVAYCLREAGITAADLDYVGFYEKPLVKLDRLLETYLAFAPRGFSSFLKAMPQWLETKLHLPRELRRGLGGGYRKRFLFPEHHESHAASAFFPSPFEEAAILTMDGAGEWATASLGTGRGNRIELLAEQRFPHSLGLLYSAFTYFCGFEVNADEYKVMGLAPYGEPVYADSILSKVIDLRPDGSLWLDQSYFDYCHGLTMTSRRFEQLFGGPPRRKDEPITEREMNLAASIQRVTEEAVLRAARHAHQTTGLRKLCLAGGVALNCVANGRLLREGPFDDIWIQPASGDAGGALGVALFIWHQLMGNARTPDPADAQRRSLLGPSFDDAEVQAVLDRQGASYRRIDGDGELSAAVAALLDEGKVVGFFQDRMEFGPRASATAASWATRGARRCSRRSTGRSSSARASGHSHRRCCALRPRPGSSSTRRTRAPTCSSFRRCAPARGAGSPPPSRRRAASSASRWRARRSPRSRTSTTRRASRPWMRRAARGFARCSRHSTAAPAVPCWSTPAST